MKLIILTAIEEFEKNVKDILTHSGVKTFSFTKVKGVKNESGKLSAENWFASGVIETNSLVFMVFIEDSCQNTIYDRVRKFNEKVEFLSRIHISTVALENFA